MSSIPDLALARLSVQADLLGALTPSLYGACVAIEDQLIVLTWYVAPEMTKTEREDLQVAGTEVIAQFPDGFRIEERFVEVPDRSSALPTTGSWVVLQRGFRTSGDY
jgi:hypothetical protein